MKRINFSSAAMKNSPSIKMPRVQRKWTTMEEDATLQKLHNTVASGELIERPTAAAYYEEMLQQLKFKNCSVSQLQNKVKNMKKTFNETKQWRSEAGQHVRENDGEETFTRITLEKCPNFAILAEIYGTHLSSNTSRTLTKKLPETDVQSQNIVVDCDVQDMVIEDVRILPADVLETSSCCSSFKAETPMPDLISMASPSKDNLLFEAQKQKTNFENRKLDLEFLKFDFEKKKWEQEFDLKQQEVNIKQQEVSLRKQELTLESKRMENTYLLSRYELELKYRSKSIFDKVDMSN